MIDFDESDIEFDVIWHPETDCHPEDSFGFDDDYIEWVHQQIDQGNEWAWCLIEVRGTWTDDEGNEYVANEFLGGCSYHSESDFKEPGGYYDSMKYIVTERIREQVYEACEQICIARMGFDDDVPKGIVRDAMIDLGLITE